METRGKAKKRKMEEKETKCKKVYKFKAKMLERFCHLTPKCVTSVNYRLLKANELIDCFKDKLIEEATEVRNARTPEEVLEKLVDVYEVFETLKNELCISVASLDKRRACKLEKHGGFKGGFFIYDVRGEEDNPGVEYYLKNSEKYPQI